jgi:hypothetical protein
LKEYNFKCSTTGREWTGKFIQRTGKFFEIEPIPMRGFQGFIKEFTYLIENLDTGITYRTGKESFNNDRKAVELTEDWHKNLEETIKDLAKQPLEYDGSKWWEYRIVPEIPLKLW